VAVTLRLARYGQKKRPFYRIVAAEKQARRDGRFIEIVGNYNPLTTPPSVELKEDKIRKWVKNGAKPSASVETLIKRHIPKLLEDKTSHQLEKIRAARKARKARAAARGTTSKAAEKKTEKKASRARAAKKA